MEVFHRQQNGVSWSQNNEIVQIEPWGQDSFRVRSTAGGELQDDLFSVLLPPVETETQITIEEQGATIYNGAIAAHISGSGLIRFFETASGDELLAEMPPRRATRVPARSFRA